MPTRTRTPTSNTPAVLRGGDATAPRRVRTQAVATGLSKHVLPRLSPRDSRATHKRDDLQYRPRAQPTQVPPNTNSKARTLPEHAPSCQLLSDDDQHRTALARLHARAPSDWHASQAEEPSEQSHTISDDMRTERTVHRAQHSHITPRTNLPTYEYMKGYAQSRQGIRECCTASHGRRR